ncbi:MAG TPA: hypothetical protein VKY24_02120 [Reyranella sp.]|nr:hypothetical protein [Reyranella sp.]
MPDKPDEKFLGYDRPSPRHVDKLMRVTSQKLLERAPLSSIGVYLASFVDASDTLADSIASQSGRLDLLTILDGVGEQAERSLANHEI